MVRRLAFALLLCGYAVAAEPRQVRAVRTDTPPVLDGKLDDACWQRAEVAGDFRRFGEGTPAAEPSEARLLFDNSHLYFACRCSEPRMDLVRRDAEKSPLTFNYAYGNTIEVFLDPGGSQRHYWQFMVNTNGATQTNLATHDPLHLGELPWRAAVFLGEDFFSVEGAVPFALLHLKPDAGTVWGLNFCRARQIGKQEAAYMYSSWQPMQGSFLRPELFGRLQLDADLSRFRFAVTVPPDIRADERCLVGVTNQTGQPRHVVAAVTLKPAQALERQERATLRLASAATVVLDLGRFRQTDCGAEVRVCVTNADTGELLYIGATQTVDETK